MSDDELLAQLQACLQRIETLDANHVEARAERRQILNRMRDAGWSLERIGQAVGRTKQTITQWLR